MSDIDDLLAADAERRQAMVEGDADKLAVFLADTLTWTHSSGKTDSRTSFLDVMRAGTTVYHSLDVRDTAVRQFGNIFILEGVVFGDVTKDGVDKKLVNRFLTVWEQTTAGGFQLQAWQSTGLA
ncbi:MAG: nuclear transport factor 2 family protein [Proteobacteria bacterium]|nr:nuclear transport factor 2 family protein [Pseudomonadota bacterium]